MADYSLTACARSLERSALAIGALARGVTSVEEARFRPDPQSWSVLEVVNHLLDEEREDFRRRLEHTLRGDSTLWPPIDPQGWVSERAYNERDLLPSLEAFLAEREASVKWLGTMGEVDLTITYEHPLGPMRAGDLAASWAAHDILHLRQLTELRYAWLRRQAEPYRPDYAGDW
jgi:hypothetical protein